MLASRVVGWLARLFGHGGTSLPGKVLLRIDPKAVSHLAGRLEREKIVISATNGKTTTAAMAAEVLSTQGTRVVHNSAGANMAGGIASALAEGLASAGNDAVGLFEVDEFWLDEVADQINPDVLLLANLFRDQLDRYGEMDTIAARWRELARLLAHRSTRLVLCADDPLVAAVGEGLANVTWYGIEDTTPSLAELPHAADSVNCRSCGGDLHYDAVLLSHLGHWRCPECQSKRPSPRVRATAVEVHGATSVCMNVTDGVSEVALEVPLPGIYNAYNALGALAIASALAMDLGEAARSIERMLPAFGRAENVVVDGIPLTMLLVKNPTGANEVIRTLAGERSGLSVAIMLNDAIADGRDVSWIWDADFEHLSERCTRVLVGGTRASEMALRLRYAGFPPEVLEICTSPADVISRAGEAPPGRLWVLPTYTAMLEFREELERRGVVEAVR